MHDHAFPAGWNAERVRHLIARYESLTESEQVAEDESDQMPDDNFMPEITKLPSLHLPVAKHIPVQFRGGPTFHPTALYRQWIGELVATEPIVALVVNVTGQSVSWARSSHRARTTLPVRIVFSPIDEGGKDITVSFGVDDAVAYGRTVVDSALTYPAPRPQQFVTGELANIGTIHGLPACQLVVLIMVRSDAKSVRNGAWHAGAKQIVGVDEPWHRILTYGRAGSFDAL
jgi:hypothetical protein